MKLKLSLKFLTRVGIYGFIECKFKKIGFYVVVHEHVIGRIVYGPLYATYIHRNLFLNYWSTCGNLMVTLWTVQCSAGYCSNAGCVTGNLH